MYKANALAPNWGQTIFQSANEIAANTVLRKRLDEIQAQTESEKQWWEKRRAQIQKEFMNELNEGEKPASKAPSAVSEDEPVLVDQNTPSATPSGGKKKKAKK
jgi:translocation protein SEC66